MQFKNYARKTVSYEKQMQITENKAKVEMTLDPLRSYLQCANIFNVGSAPQRQQNKQQKHKAKQSESGPQG